MSPQSGFENKFGSNVYRLRKLIYGLKQSPRAWFKRLSSVVTKQGYKPSQSNHMMFVKISTMKKIVVLIVYVDDIILTGDDMVEIEEIKKTCKGIRN